jgi:outer membrane protein OmpA-like peptidoglycan-associated protein
MIQSLRTALRRSAAVLSAGAVCATGLTLATAAPSQAEPITCSISFTPDTIGPGQSTVAALTTNAPVENYYGVISVNGVAGPSMSLGNTNTGSLPYEGLAPYYLQNNATTVLDYQIFWSAPQRRASDPEPLCHATLTLVPAAAAPVTPPVTTPTTPTTPAAPAPAPAELTVKAAKGLPLSAGTAKLQTVSTAGGAVTLKSLTPQVCGVQKSSAVLHQAGLCKVSASQEGAATVTTSIQVWPTPDLPARATTPRLLTVLGQGEGGLQVSAKPASVCRETDGAVAVVNAGTCRVTVRDHGDVVRRAKVAVSLSADPATVKDRLSRAATVYFGFNSAALTPAGEKSLRSAAKKLRKADLVVVYGHTFGPGRNSHHSRALAERRAKAVVAELSTLGVKAKQATTVPLAMQQPVSSQAWKNRRAEVYFR